jgi:hypothetical protein
MQIFEILDTTKPDTENGQENGQDKEDEMGGTCRTNGAEEECV